MKSKERKERLGECRREERVGERDKKGRGGGEERGGEEREKERGREGRGGERMGGWGQLFSRMPWKKRCTMKRRGGNGWIWADQTEGAGLMMWEDREGGKERGEARD